MKSKHMKRITAILMAMIITILQGGGIPIFAGEDVPSINMGTFQNVYAASPGDPDYTITGISVELAGKQLTAGMFPFTAYSTDSTFTKSVLGGITLDITNEADGSLSFKPGSYDRAKTYYYNVYLLNFDGIENYTITNRKAMVTVEVKDVGGVLTPTATITNPVISLEYTPPTDSWIQDSWDYEIAEKDGQKYVILKRYDGDETSLTIYGKVIIAGESYPVYLSLAKDEGTGKYNSFLSGNQKVKKVKFAAVDGTKVRTTLPGQANGLFRGMTALTQVQFNNGFDDGLTDISGMFEGCTSLQYGSLLNLDLSSCRKAEDAFKGCTALRSINMYGVDFGSLEDASGMFSGCVNLAEINLSDTAWNEALQDTDRMFAGAGKLGAITVSSNFPAGASCTDMFSVTGETKLTVTGTPSETFLNRVCPTLKAGNRYLGEVSANAHVALSGNALQAGMFTVKLYRDSEAEGNLITAAANDADGLVSFGKVKVYDVTNPLVLVAAEDEKANMTVENRTITKEADIGLNADGSLYLKE